MNDVHELIAASLGAEQADAADGALDVVWNSVRTRFVGGGQDQLVFRIPRTETNAPYWDRLQATQRRWQLEYCYCSVFDECWFVPSKWVEPVQVEECKRDEPNEFVP